jgi:hypothetical protein
MKPIAYAVAVLALSSCFATKRLTDPVHHSSRRSSQLMVLAASEAKAIPDADVRLTRQLNIANDILLRYGKEGASEALLEATETLNTVGPSLNGHALLSGWVSVAQIARRASAEGLAIDAVNRAMREIERMPNAAERCDYVIDVAEEASSTLGAPQAVALLMKSGDWAQAIASAQDRRNARLAFASALFNLEDYEAGAGILRKEKDALWSSDALIQLASPGTVLASASPNFEGSAAAAHPISEAMVDRPAPRGPAAESDDELRPQAVEPQVPSARRGLFSFLAADAPPTPVQPPVQARKYGKKLGFESVFKAARRARSSRFGSSPRIELSDVSGSRGPVVLPVQPRWPDTLLRRERWCFPLRLRR